METAENKVIIDVTLAPIDTCMMRIGGIVLEQELDYMRQQNAVGAVIWFECISLGAMICCDDKAKELESIYQDARRQEAKENEGKAAA